MSNIPMCTWCGDTGHSLSECPIAPEPDRDGEGLKWVTRFNKMIDEVEEQMPIMGDYM